MFFWPIYLLLPLVFGLCLLGFDLYFRIKVVGCLDRIIELTGSPRISALWMIFIPLVSPPAGVLLVCRARRLLRSMPDEYRDDFGMQLQRLRPGVLWSLLRILTLASFFGVLAAWLFQLFYASNIDDVLTQVFLERLIYWCGLLLLVSTSLLLICGFQFVAQMKLLERIVRSLLQDPSGSSREAPPTNPG